MIDETGFALSGVDARAAAVVCLSGDLDSHTALALADQLDQQLAAAVAAGQRLILDMSAVALISAAALRVIDARTRHLTEPVLCVTAAPHVNALLGRTGRPGLIVYPTLAEALAALDARAAAVPSRAAALPQAPREASSLHETVAEVQDLRNEVYGLMAKPRTRSPIGIAQGVVLERYRLDSPEQAFDLLRETSRAHKVPLRVLADAVIAAPPPAAAGAPWFPGRRPTAAPGFAFLEVPPSYVDNRLVVLRSCVYRAVSLTGADAAELHLTDPVGQDLVLEAHFNLDSPYRTAVAQVSEPPTLCAQARKDNRSVSVSDITSDPVLASTPQGRAAISLGSRSLHAAPAIEASTGRCIGVLTLHRSVPHDWMSPAQCTALEALAAEFAAWCSWYQSSVVLSALEDLHTRARGFTGLR